MADSLKTIYNVCDPYKPATAEHYRDCSDVRGSSALVHAFQQHLALAGDHLCFLFSGHIGCGKSSELEHLARTLLAPRPPHAAHFPILLNVSEYVDDYDVAPTDLLLAIVSEVAATLRERLGVDLKANYFVRRFDEIKEFFLSKVEISEGELPLGGAKVKIQRLKKDPAARHRVRAALELKMTTMIEEINTVFDEARCVVRRHRTTGGQTFQDIVIILDNLEKIRRIGQIDEGLPSQRELFVDRYTQLTGMNAHVIYTVPLRLVRSADGPILENRYGPLFVLPMIKVVERGSGDPYQSGLAALRDLLAKRLGRLPLTEAFAEDALEFLLTYSGGHVRLLMTFVQNACTYASETPIPLAAAHRAVQQIVRTFSGAIPEIHWSKLARLDRSTDQQIPNGDADYLQMLENLSVLEYVNGGGEDPFALAEPWYAVNPIVRELQKFKAAAIALSSTSSNGDDHG